MIHEPEPWTRNLYILWTRKQVTLFDKLRDGGEMDLCNWKCSHLEIRLEWDIRIEMCVCGKIVYIARYDDNII